MENKIDQAIKRMIDGDLRGRVTMPLELAATCLDDPIVPGTLEYRPALFIVSSN